MLFRLMYLSVITIAFFSTPNFCLAETSRFSEIRVLENLKQFVAEPHPMGSVMQKKLANQWQRRLQSIGWQTKIQDFKSKVPNTNLTRFGGKRTVGSSSLNVTGYNIIAQRPGTQACTVIIAGHYDTKFFREFKFVGANDGGSSSALMLDLARALGSAAQAKASASDERWIDCTIMLIFFDGEEALLPEWYQAQQDLEFQKMGGLQDNLYGSRAFVKDFLPKDKSLKKNPLVLAIVIDMIGHKDQNISITAGSHIAASEQLLSVKRDVLLSNRAEAIQDDHVPLQMAGIPVVHMIDWTNIQDHWHKAADNLEIVSAKKIANFGNVLLDFLLLPRK